MQIDTIETAGAEVARAEFSADTDALEAAAAFLAKRLINRRNTIPILSHIRIEASPAGEVTLTGSDRDNWASVTVPAMVYSPGAVCVDAGPFADALAKVRKGKCPQVTVEHGENGRAAIKAGRTRFNAPTLPVDDFPLPPTGELDSAAPLSRFTVPAARFLADLAALAPCQSTEETRYYLNGIALQVRDLAGRERFTMAATDGHNIGAASRELPAGAETLPDAILRSKAVSLLGKAAKLASDAETMAIEFDTAGRSAGLFRLDLGPVSIWTKAIDGTFPDWAKCFDGDQLTPTDEAEAPLFPELIPGTPLAAMAKLGKGAAIEWQDATAGKFGTVPGDDGLIFGALNLRADIAEPLKGYRYSHEQGDYAAREYLTGLAVKRHGAILHDWNVRLVTDANGYQGLTVGKTEYIAGHYVETANWETLAIERVYIEGRSEYLEGAYSVVMPRERAERRSDVTLEIDGDSTVYPIAVNSGGKIHLTADQVRGQIGETCFAVMEITLPNGKPAHILQWLWDQGDSRFLTVRPDGRCYGAKAAPVYVTRAEIEAGPVQGEPEAELPEAVAVEQPEICPEMAQESESGPVAGDGQGEALADAPEGPEIAPEAISDISGNIPAPDPMAELAARVAALEAMAATPLSAVSAEPPSGEAAQAKRTPAHERAVRRAWAERAQSRGHRSLWHRHREARNAADDGNAELAREASRARLARENTEAMNEKLKMRLASEMAKRTRSTLLARRRGAEMSLMAKMMKNLHAKLQAAQMAPRYTDEAGREGLDLVGREASRAFEQRDRAEAAEKSVRIAGAAVERQQEAIERMAEAMEAATLRAIRAETALAAIKARENGWPPAVRSVSVNFAA